jgi:hypothetical protein
MRDLIWPLIERWAARLPRQFRVLHRQFLLRVIDLEALSLEADVPAYLGQFAGILIMLSLCHGIGLLFFPPAPPEFWAYEQARIADMQLVVGLCSVLMWDTTFPDKRDAMVLGPLPVLPRTILLAKLPASATVLGIAVVTLNFASSLSMAVVFGGSTGTPGMIRFFAAWWFTLLMTAALIYGAVLAIQGLGTLLLPRRLFLRVSAVLQIVAFGVFLAGRFLQPWLATFSQLTSPVHRGLLASSATFWSFALFNQINGSLPRELFWIAHRAWIALGIVLTGAVVSLLLSYLRAMKQIVEEPDLVPGPSSRRWVPRFGSSLQSAIALFSLRSITRSRQHRVALAFYWSVVFAIGLSMIQQVATTPPEPVSLGLIMPTFIMMCFAILGLRGVFSLPISLKANWILRVTQLRPTKDYVAATRRSLLLFGLAPILILSAALSVHFRPWSHSAEHLAFLAIFGCVLVELSLIHFDKVPFTCSYLPGKTNIQVVFWGFAFVFLILGLLVGTWELAALAHPRDYCTLVGVSAAAAVALWLFNRIHARSAVLYYEETLPEVITRLGLTWIPPVQLSGQSKSSPL